MRFLTIEFPDFRRFCEKFDRRIYYYQLDNIVELYFLSEGFVFKCFVDITSVKKDSFFADRIFIGATRLLYRLQDNNETQKDISDLANVVLEESVVDKNLPVEAKTKELDDQKEGVNIELPGA